MRAGDVLEEPAVVAHDEERARLGGEELLEPEDALEVEVVRGLVEQQSRARGRAPARSRARFRQPPEQRRRGARRDRRTRTARERLRDARRRATSSRSSPASASATARRRSGPGERRMLRHVRERRPGGGARSCRRPASRGRASTRSSVDLPQPFGPTSPTRSPSWMPNERSANSGAAP